MKIIKQTLKNVTIGEPITHKNLVMFPLLGGDMSEPGYLTFEEALATNRARVTEVSASGSVPELRFENDCDKPIFLLDGEELIGAKQNRMLNLTIMVPAKSSINIPVSCVEAGRWNSVSKEFGSSGRAQYSKVRARKMGHVSESLRQEGSRRSNQSDVWADIDNKMASMSVESETNSADEMYTHHGESVESYVSAIRHVPGQCGAVFSINGRVIGMDLFDHVLTMNRMLPKLIRSYSMDAIEKRSINYPLDMAGPDHLLSDIIESQAEWFSAVGLGEDLRLTGNLCQGAALCINERIVHLCAFKNTTDRHSSSQDENAQIVPASVRRRRYH